MAEEINKETEEIKEETEEELQAYRKELAAEVFDGKEPEEPAKEEVPPKEDKKEEEVKEEESEKEAPPDPWEGVNPELKKTLENISYRLKQSESRIGSMQNQIHAAKEVKETTDAPSKEEIDKAKKDEEAWEDLKEEYPEWAEAIDRRLSEKTAMFDEKLPVIEGQVQGQGKTVQELAQTVERLTLALRYPDWENTIKSDKYTAWLAVQNDETKGLTTSPYAKDAIAVLDLFEASKPAKPEKTAAEIAAERKARLKKGETLDISHKETPAKSEVDMTEQEVRKKIKDEVWNE